jgi:membrane protease YdiL (CAAX protease family)
MDLVAAQAGLWMPLLVVCAIVSRRYGTGSVRRDLGWSFRRVDVGYGVAGWIAGRIAATIALLPFVWLLQSADAPQSDVYDDVTRYGGGWAVLILLTVVGAPLVEETFFRGLLQPRLCGRLGVPVGITVTSLLFGAAHLIGWQGPISLALAWSIAGGGLVLCLLRHYTGRLGPSIAAHMFFNAQALVIVALSR